MNAKKSPRMSVCCCTYNRSRWLGELIQSYMNQTYPVELRELIILDDAGQYENMRGDGWQLVSFPRKFASLGEKRNACVSLAHPESEIIVVADDDDIYLPHWLEAHAKNFDQGAVWSYAKELYWSERNNILFKWVYPGKGWIMHPGHAFLKKVFWQAGGYPHLAWKEDAGLFLAFYDMGLQPVDAVKDYDVSYLIYRQKLDADHRPTGGMPLEEYQKDIGGPQLPKAALAIGWKKKYSDLVHTFEKNRIVSKSTF